MNGNRQSQFGAVLLAFILTIVLVPKSFGQGDAPDADSVSKSDVLPRVEVILDSVMSPYCPGRTLSACPSDDARVLRDEIVSWVEQGASEEDVKASLVKMFGPSILGVPENRGIGVLAWLAPAIFLVIGGAIVLAIILRRDRTSSAQGQENQSRGGNKRTVDSAMESRIEQELRTRIQ